MKKQIFYLLSLIAIGLFACTPTSEWDDMYDDLEAENAKAYNAKYGKQVLSGAYTLTDDDYAMSSNESVKKYKNFSFSAKPDALIPEILNKKFYSDNKGEEVPVSYNYYSKVKPNTGSAYKLSDADYKSVGNKYPNFDNEDDAKKYIPAILNTKPKLTLKAAGTFQTVEWTFYYSKTTEYIKIKDDFSAIKLAKKPEKVDYTLSKQDYKDAGQKYPSFTKYEDAEAAIIKIAKDGGKGAGVYAWTWYKKRTATKYLVCKKTEKGWELAKSVALKTLLFKYTNDFKWVFVPPLKYIITTEATTIGDITLTDADYELTGDGKYKNFYMKGKSDDEKNAIIIEKLTIILKANYDIKLNDVVKVTFNVYTGDKGTMSVNIKAVEDK